MRFACAILLLVGCNHAPLDPVDVERDARFAGLWIVDQPTHAGYEASLYDFAADGSLALVRSIGYGWPDANERETGVVGTPSLRCSFGASWRSKGPEVLIVDGVCTDERAREITLGLFADAALNAVDAPVEVLTVGGERGWQHFGWPWRFRKCTNAAEECIQPF